MNLAPCTVAVDVGNTAIKLAVRKEQTIIDHTLAIDQADWQAMAIQWVQSHLGCGSTRWRISSVHRRAAERLIAAIKAVGPVQPSAHTIDLVSFHDVPMPIEVDEPNRLGIDRLLSAYAASRQIDPERRRGGMVVIDAGSAITIDFVDHESKFRGGAIMPGLELQARSLAAGTDALPQISWKESVSPKLPAPNTRDAIYSGILLGTAGAIDRLVDCLMEASPEPHRVPIILTGGNSAVLTPHIQHEHERFSHLVCRGLLE